MAFVKISDSIPEFYHRFLPEVVKLEVPPEAFTTCEDCPLICSSVSEVGKDKAKPFSPETKCCTFSPRIPNYMVGAILKDDTSEGREGKMRLIKAINSKMGVFPNGVYPTKKYKILYEAARNDSFGRSKTLLCPYFVPGKYNCTIWKYREAICALWFCKHIAGVSGYAFWNTLIEYMKYVQESLISLCFARNELEYFDPYGNDITISYEDLEDLPMKSSVYSKIWGKWEGREEEFYINCFDIVNSLNKDDFNSLLSVDQNILLEKIILNYKNIVELPEYFVRSANFNQEALDGYYLIEINHYIERIDSSVAYTFSLPDYVLDVFDGSTSTTEAVEKIYLEHQVVIEPEILISLYHHNIIEKSQ